ncbi:MAG: DUF1552 domain-containing protein [Verrucomicrobiota bacterium]
MNTPSRQSRRRFLRGMGASLAVPPFLSLAPHGQAASRALATTANGSPLRLAYLYIPNGVNPSLWNPRGVGNEFQLNETMRPIAKFQQDLTVITQLAHDKGWAGSDDGGDHARANATFLTGARPRKTSGADIQLGVSVDQLIARQISDETRLSSLELTCASVRNSGRCDSGYSCAYQFNLSWQSETTPMTPEPNPRLVFERLFGSGSPTERRENLQRRFAEKRSILDYLLEDAHSLHRDLGRNDQQKLDEYLTGVREVERQIEKAERFPVPDLDPAIHAPEGIPRLERRAHARDV